MTTNKVLDGLLEDAKAAGFHPHSIHGGLIVKHSSGAWVDISEQLAKFAQLQIERSRVQGEVVGYVVSDFIEIMSRPDGYTLMANKITKIHTIPLFTAPPQPQSVKDALEAAAKAMQPMLRDMISRSEAYRIIKALITDTQAPSEKLEN